jgi:hypothetical protein
VRHARRARGNFQSPFDLLGDKLRGYVGLTMDM